MPREEGSSERELEMSTKRRCGIGVIDEGPPTPWWNAARLRRRGRTKGLTSPVSGKMAGPNPESRVRRSERLGQLLGISGRRTRSFESASPNYREAFHAFRISGLPPEAIHSSVAWRATQRDWFLPRKTIFRRKREAAMRPWSAELNSAMVRFAGNRHRSRQGHLPDLSRYALQPEQTPYKDHIAASFHAAAQWVTPTLGIIRVFA